MKAILAFKQFSAEPQLPLYLARTDQVPFSNLHILPLIKILIGAAQTRLRLQRLAFFSTLLVLMPGA